jgi:hypothetical protein
MTWEALLLGLLVGIGWFWSDSLRKREIALAAARRVCEQAGVQLLDETVALHRLRVRKDENMHSRFYREFSFEYSAAGDDRHPGRIYLLGEANLGVSLIQPSR